MLRTWILFKRNVGLTFQVKGRLSELVVFPISTLVIWGMLFSSGIITRELIGPLLVINILWAVGSHAQGQINMPLLMDLWAREFSEIMREGVSISEYLMAKALYGLSVGLLTLTICALSIPLAFGGGWLELYLLFAPMPVVILTATALAYLFTGVVFRYGRAFGFLSWTGLPFIIMLSSPYTPISTLWYPLQLISYLSPFTFAFEFVRSQELRWLLWGAIEAALLFGVCYLYLRFAFSYACKNRGLDKI